MFPVPTRSSFHAWILLAAIVITAMVYWPGLRGGFLFDDYPNIVDNHGVQPANATLSSLVGAALSSPASDFKRPLASLSFAANYLASGMDPYWMKLTNLVIHLLNGLLVFLLARALLQSACVGVHSARNGLTPAEAASGIRLSSTDQLNRTGLIAALIATGWMLLPINLTSVLYVVQRMESMANLFVLLGLLGYVTGRNRMLIGVYRAGLATCIASLVVPTLLGLLAKETAVMLPLYAALIEWTLFGFRGARAHPDRPIRTVFFMLLIIPLVVGCVLLLPGLLRPAAWATRDFTLSTRLLSEARIVVDYIGWTLVPTPQALSFYHDNFHISQGLLAPWTTLASIIAITILVALTVRLRRRQPLVALGLALFVGCQLLTSTVLPLELIYEHRNYFASFGLLLAIVPLLVALPKNGFLHTSNINSLRIEQTNTPPFFALPRRTLLIILFLWWGVLTGITAAAWGSPLRLAEELAWRAPDSPRAQYELGRTYIIYSHYNPLSPFTSYAYEPLERAAALPGSSILPEQALIFMNSRMHLPLKEAWWNSMITKLKARKPGVQDESSLGALTQCTQEGQCVLPQNRMVEAFMAALSYPAPSARLLAIYGDYAWNVLEDHALGERLIEDAIASSPNEPAYQITFIRMLTSQGRVNEADRAIQRLQQLNIGGRLDSDLDALRIHLHNPSSS